MARKIRRCRGPVNQLVMHRMKGISGPNFQHVGGGTCVKGAGNFYAPGMPGSGPQAVFGVVIDNTTIQIGFTRCVVVSAITDVEYRIDGGGWTATAGFLKISDTQWQFTTGNIDSGDAVDWRYVGGSNSIVDCAEAEDIGDQDIPVLNPIVALEFHAITPASDYEMLGVKKGTGGLTEGRASNILWPDWEDIYREFGANEPSYVGGRVTGAVGSRVVYADDGVNPLPEVPWMAYAPEATNRLTYSNDLTAPDWVPASVVLAGITNPVIPTAVATKLTGTGIVNQAIRYIPDPRPAFSAVEDTFSLILKPDTATLTNIAVYDVTGSSWVLRADIDWTVPSIVVEAGAGSVNLEQIGSTGAYMATLTFDGTDGNLFYVAIYPTGRSNLSTTALDVYHTQVEFGRVATPPILTSGAAVTRDACALSFDAANHDDTVGAYYCEFDLTGDSALIDGFLSLVNPNAVLSDGTNQTTLACATGERSIGFVYGEGNMELCVGGVWSAQVAYDGTMLQGVLDLFRAATVMGYANDLQRWSGTYVDLKAKIDELMA